MKVTKSSSNILIAVLLFLNFYLLLQYSTVNKVGAVDDHQQQALLSFKSLLSDPRHALSSWNLSSPHCSSWFGISCARNTTKVQSLRLAGLGLSGPIAPHLSSLTWLKLLDLSNNSFVGQIPPALGNLSSLRDLALARNVLSGELPADLGRLTRLRTIQLSENQLTGTIPAFISNLSSMVFLSLTQNRLSGGIPAGIGSSLSNLQSLYLGMNALGGRIPSSLSNASKLQFLDLTNNSFHGSIPLLGSLNDLTWLCLGVNNLSSTTQENYDMFSSLTNCTHLNYLTLDTNQLAGELPSSVANLSIDLAHFCMDDNYLTGKFPQGMHRYRNLISLTLEHNLFMGEIPNSLGLLHSLQKLRAKDNSFSGTIPDVFGNLSRLYELHLGHNHLSGEIPASLTSSQRLSYLSLDWNCLSGTFPKEASSMANLKYLNLAHNFFHGALPAEVTTLIRQLIALDVSGNQLSGTIQTAIGNSMSLTYLSMASNAFTGQIPKSLGDMPALETLDLSGNNLTGPIPAEMGNLKHLRRLNLSSNGLEGGIPSKGVFANLTADSLSGNYKLCSDAAAVAGKLGLRTCRASGKSGRLHNLLLRVILPVACFVVLGFAVACILWILASKKKKSKIEDGSASSTALKGLPHKISYLQIRQATNNFSPENLVGKGGYGCVYRADFRTEDGTQSQTTLAVKVLDLQHGGHGASKSFTAECEALRNVRHRNLVKVFTSCSSIDHGWKEFKALVMEFMANGNLDKWLYPRDESMPTLNLTQRLNIAVDIASAMDYLHHDCDPPVVHCDLKPGNVLLDDHMTAHIGDFGLSRILRQNPLQKESSTMGVKGSIGYIAPEYGLGSKASTSGDVYSFGILVLEIFTARKPTSEMFGEGLNLGQFPPSTAQEDHRACENADPRLFMDSDVLGTGYPSGDNNSRHGDVSSNRLGRDRECIGAVMRLGLACAVNSAKDRLTMRDALRKLHEIRTSLLRP